MSALYMLHMKEVITIMRMRSVNSPGWLSRFRPDMQVCENCFNACQWNYDRSVALFIHWYVKVQTDQCKKQLHRHWRTTLYPSVLQDSENMLLWRDSSRHWQCPWVAQAGRHHHFQHSQNSKTIFMFYSKREWQTQGKGAVWNYAVT